MWPSFVATLIAVIRESFVSTTLTNWRANLRWYKMPVPPYGRTPLQNVFTDIYRWSTKSQKIRVNSREGLQFKWQEPVLLYEYNIDNIHMTFEVARTSDYLLRIGPTRCYISAIAFVLKTIFYYHENQPFTHLRSLVYAGYRQRRRNSNSTQVRIRNCSGSVDSKDATWLVAFSSPNNALMSLHWHKQRQLFASLAVKRQCMLDYS